LPHADATKQKVRYVGARDQEHEPDRAQQDEKCWSYVTHHYVSQQLELHPVPRILLRVLRGQARGKGRHLGLGLSKRDFRFQPPHYVQVVRPAVERVRINAQRPPKLGPIRE
jgi:hypothetical protein